MNSRMEKYSNLNYEEETPSRVSRNQKLYNDISMSDFSDMKPNDNIRIIENTGNKIDLSKIKEYLESNDEEEVQTRSIVVKDNIDDIPQNNIFEEEKDYDINSVLEKAKENKESYYEDEKHKKLRDTQYDILSKIKMYDEVSQESEIVEDKVELNTDEKTLIDLINTVTKNKSDLLEELKKGSENTIVTSPIKEEVDDEIISKAIEEEKRNTEENTKSDIQPENDVVDAETDKKEDTFELKDISETNTTLKNLDKSFYTNSMTFSKEDFEGFEELEKTVKKNNNLVKLSIIVLVLLALVTIFIVLKYVLNLF